MDIKTVETEADYRNAIDEIGCMLDADPGTLIGDRLEALVTLVEAYEEKHYKISLPSPIDAIEFHMERLGLSKHDLESCIGSRDDVSDALNRKLALTPKMIRNLEEALGIPYDILAQRYSLVVENENVNKGITNDDRDTD